MKANEFVKKFGLDLAKREYIVEHYGFDILDDLKRLVESHELVEAYGGLDKAKLRCYPAKHLTMQSYYALRNAIADVESCQ